MSVSVQQASANAFAAWLGSQLTDVKIYNRWPKSTLPAKAITVVAAGNRRDTKLDPQILSATNNGSSNTDAVYRIAACFQPFQLDVWATSHLDRDDIIARLDDLLHADASALTGAFNPMPVGNGVLIALADGWEAANTIADFQFAEPNMDDTGEEVDLDQYRATYHGGAHVMLTVTKTTARQTTSYFQLQLRQTDSDAATTTYQVP